MAKDFIHYFVKEALKNAGWEVTDDPFTIKLNEDDTFFDIDLAAKRSAPSLAIQRIVAIEIKSFTGGSIINAFHEALGQYLNYQAAIDEQDLNLELFLAVSDKGWERLNEYKFIQRRIIQYQLQFLVVDVNKKIISKWID